MNLELEKVSDETNDEENGVNVIIPIIYDDFFKNKDLSFRYERYERIKSKVRKQYEKYGMENTFDNYETCIISLKYPDHFSEEKIFFMCSMGTFLLIFEDLVDGSLNYKYNIDVESNNKQSKTIRKTVLLKYLITFGFKTLRLKLSIYQWYLFFKSVLIYLKSVIFRSRLKVYNNYEDYAKQRRIDIGSDAIVIGTHKTFGFDFKPNLLNHPLIKKFNFLFTDLVWQINDLYSFKKEFIRGEHQLNAITVLRNENKTSWQSSVDMLTAIIENNLKELNERLNDIVESKLEVSHYCLELMIYTLYVHCLVYAKSKRYNIAN